MQIRVNGKAVNVDGAATVRSLLEERSLNPQTVAVELNMDIVKREDYSGTALKEGDVLEIVRFVGGGT